MAREQGVAQGRKLKTDSTVVESNIPYPTDSSLLGDSIRVFSRGLARIAAPCKKAAVKVVNPTRAVKYRWLEISRAAKSLTPAHKRRMQKSYKKLVARRQRVVRESGKVIQRWQKGKLPVVGSWVSVATHIARLRHFGPQVAQVIQPTKQRVLGGNQHVAGKILSLFEPHSQVIRKGKAHKPNEFGRLVRVDEVENGIVSGYQVREGNAPDTQSFIPAGKQHQAQFGRAPEMATADRGFFSAKNEREAKELGVKKVAVPGRGRLSRKRAQHQEQRWFQRALRWRAGIEATISNLKHPFSMERALYKGEGGFQRYVGWSVITKNLFSIAPWQERKKPQHRKNLDQIDGVLSSATQATR